MNDDREEWDGGGEAPLRTLMTKKSRRRFRRRGYKNRGEEVTVRDKAEVTVDWVMRARGKNMKEKAHGPGDCLVSEILWELQMKIVYEITHWFGKRFRGECRARQLGRFFVWCS